MTLQQYWTLIIKRWPFVLACFVVAGAGTYTASDLLTPQYQSTALIQVVILSGNSLANYDSVMASDQLVQTEAQLALSSSVLNEVATHYHSVTAAQLASEVSATPRVNTQILEIDVINANPKLAARLANDVAATLIKQQIQSAQQENQQTQQQIQQDLLQTQQQITTITNSIATLQGETPKDTTQIQDLQVQLNGLQQHYSQAQTDLLQLELAQAQNVSFLHVVQSAQPSSSPVRPNKVLNTAAGLAVGLLLGILLAVLIELLDFRIRSIERLTEQLNWSVLATVWRLDSKDQSLTSITTGSINDEAYRILRTNIGFKSIGKPVQSLVVTSAIAGEGKSTIAANLALFIARAGKKTLLIDADLHSPRQHTIWGLPDDTRGLSDAILSFSSSFMADTSTQTSSVLSPMQTPPVPSTSSQWSDPAVVAAKLEPFIHTADIPHLSVMPAGSLPPDPSELLSSKAFSELLVALGNWGAEVMIFDTPPLLSLSDASLLSSKVDGTLIVIDISQITKTNLAQMKALISQVNAFILGCVVNKQRRVRKDATYTYFAQNQSNHSKGAAGNVHFSTVSLSPATIAAPVPPALLSNSHSENNAHPGSEKLLP